MHKFKAIHECQGSSPGRDTEKWPLLCHNTEHNSLLEFSQITVMLHGNVLTWAKTFTFWITGCLRGVTKQTERKGICDQIQYQNYSATLQNPATQRCFLSRICFLKAPIPGLSLSCGHRAKDVKDVSHSTNFVEYSVPGGTHNFILCSRVQSLIFPCPAEHFICEILDRKMPNVPVAITSCKVVSIQYVLRTPIRLIPSLQLKEHTWLLSTLNSGV